MTAEAQGSLIEEQSRGAASGAGYGYGKFAAIVLMIGGLLFPYTGWALGVVLVLFAHCWSRREKLLFLASPLVLAVAALIWSKTATGAAQAPSLGNSTSAFTGPSATNFFASPGVSMTALTMASLCWLFAGIVLFLLALRRQRGMPAPGRSSQGAS